MSLPPHPDRKAEEVAELVTSEIVSLTEADLAALFPFVVALQSFATADGPGSDGQSFWLVARDEDRVLYWDSVEEEFAIGTLKGHFLTGVSNCGEKLKWAIKAFLKERASG
jgi:hypothetical protein